MDDADDVLTEARKTGVDFLLTDLRLAFTFMEVAAVSGSEETTKRNHEKAHEASQTVLRLLDRVRPEPPERAAISEKLALLKERLDKVGHRF